MDSQLVWVKPYTCYFFLCWTIITTEYDENKHIKHINYSQIIDQLAAAW